jgi:CHAT domain
VAAELGLRFPYPGTVVVRLDQDGGFDETPAQTFEARLVLRHRRSCAGILKSIRSNTPPKSTMSAPRVWLTASRSGVRRCSRRSSTPPRRAAWSIASSKPPSPAGAYDADGRVAERAKHDALARPGGGRHLLRHDQGPSAQQGYLLFEHGDRSADYVSAEELGDLLNRQKVGLVVLSACQSAMIGGEDPMGSVAARLTHAGIPSVLAMTQSVLISTTRARFGQFYGELARGRPIGTALDNARRDLLMHSERGERERLEGPISLKLQDWFLPALYQVGGDTPLLTAEAASEKARAKQAGDPPDAGADNLREAQESGFHGRTRSSGTSSAGSCAAAAGWWCAAWLARARRTSPRSRGAGCAAPACSGVFASSGTPRSRGPMCSATR